MLANKNILSLDREESVKKILKCLSGSYNISEFARDEVDLPVVARCDYFAHSEKYVLSKKAELWSADTEEFLFLYSVPKLTMDVFEKCKEHTLKDGMGRMNIGPGHMCTYLTAIFLCDECEPEVVKALKKCRVYKSFRFSLYGWMDYHNVAVVFGSGDIVSNYAGRSTAKIMKNILFTKRRKGVEKR